MSYESAFLPTDTIPKHYDLILDPNLDDGIFFGKVSITFDIKEPRDHIILHAKFLNITSTQLFKSNLSTVSVLHVFEYPKNDFLIVKLNEILPAGSYNLKIDFNGSLTTSIVGFYRSSYTKSDGVTRYLASTKFEPTFARRAFPCFDEPAYKAAYTIKLVHPSAGGYYALSNMHEIGREENYPIVGKTTVKFAQTPPMASYLACFIICDFPKLGPVLTKSGTNVNVYAREEQITNALKARDLAVKVMDWFADYFKTDYPLKKLDLIAIPDFISGAMENWGLITFRETRMLISNDSGAASVSETQSTVSHELAHMWFGDLVTMKWWDDLWLNEGFATFMSLIVLNDLYPDSEAVPRFLMTLQGVLDIDAALSSHPVIQPVNHPDQITEIFDQISYGKGSSVLRMFENFYPAGFRKAVQKYLNKFEYENAETSDLWAHLAMEYAEVTDLPRMLNTWTKQMGFPLINVQRTGDRLTLSQSRCLKNKNNTFDTEGSPYKYKWDIPIKYITSANKYPQKTVFYLDQDERVDWFKINAQQVGFYRVNYLPREWSVLSETLLYNSSVMSGLDRANLLDDALSLAQGGYLDYAVPFKLLDYLRNGEKHWLPWHVVSIQLTWIYTRLGSSSTANLLKDFVKKLIVDGILRDDLWTIGETASTVERYLKQKTTSFACKFDDATSLKKANELFKQWIAGGEKPPVDLREVIYSYGLSEKGREQDWSKLWELYLIEQDPVEKDNLRIGLVRVKNTALLERLLNYMKNESYIKSQDYFMFMASMAATHQGAEVVWNYLKNNWTYLIERFSLNDRQFGNILPTVFKQFSTEEKLNELNNFLSKYKDEGAGAQGRKRALDIIKSNILWYKTYKPEIERVLQINKVEP